MTRFVFVAMGLIAANGCSQGPEISQDLQMTVAAYYEAEKIRDWDTTWHLRPATYRSLQAIEGYKVQMQADSEGWQLRTARIVKVIEKSNDVVVLLMEFEESPSETARAMFGIPSSQSTFKITERTEWVKEGGAWRCNVCASRSHFTLNSTA